MKILAIESSCDETAAAVIEDGTQVLSNVVVSQIDIFKVYGGVIPEVAARSHLEAILPVIHQALTNAQLTRDDIDVIAVTHTPGLLGSLLIGTLTARMLAILWQKPLYAVHHLKSHIYANWLQDSSAGRTAALKIASARSQGDKPSSLRSSSSPCASSRLTSPRDSDQLEHPEFPLLALVVSGGHTQIIWMTGHDQFEIIGTTRDDAVGECFDKVAKILGLPYPGGPSIAKVALQATAAKKGIKLPHPKVTGLDFSFSGLKTAVLRAVQAECGLPISTPSFELQKHLSEAQKADFAAAFQETACEILIEKLQKALEGHPEARSVVIAGGVSANQLLRQKASEELLGASQRKMPVFFPELRYAGDNAAMVGAAAFFEIQAGVQPTDPYSLNIAARTPIDR